MRKRKYLTPFATLCFLGLAAACVFINLRIRELDSTWVEPPIYGELRYQKKLFELMSFGHMPIAVDWLWIKTLQDPSYFHIHRNEHTQAFYDLDLLTDLDPAWWEVYYYGANLLAVIRDDVFGARDLLEKGDHFRRHELSLYGEKFANRFWAASWAVPLLLAYDYLYELKDLPQAAKAFQETAEIPGAPTYLKQLKDRLEKPDGQYQMGLHVLAFMLESARDPKIRETLQEKRHQLEVGQFLFQINYDFRDYCSRSERRGKRPSKNWSDFLIESQRPDVDPWGGALSIDPSGKIATTTPHQSVYGLE